jgi:hypothetical protein
MCDNKFYNLYNKNNVLQDPIPVDTFINTYIKIPTGFLFDRSPTDSQLYDPRWRDVRDPLMCLVKGFFSFTESDIALLNGDVQLFSAPTMNVVRGYQTTYTFRILIDMTLNVIEDTSEYVTIEASNVTMNSQGIFVSFPYSDLFFIRNGRFNFRFDRSLGKVTQVQLMSQDPLAFNSPRSDVVSTGDMLYFSSARCQFSFVEYHPNYIVSIALALKMIAAFNPDQGSKPFMFNWMLSNNIVDTGIPNKSSKTKGKK